MRALKRSEVEVECIVWANGIMAVPFKDLVAGNIPKAVGRGTQGEVVARYMNENNVFQAVIITDNAAGQIRTKITTKVHLCLLPASQRWGSFLDRNMVPNCTQHELEPGA